MQGTWKVRKRWKNNNQKPKRGVWAGQNSWCRLWVPNVYPLSAARAPAPLPVPIQPLGQWSLQTGKLSFSGWNQHLSLHSQALSSFYTFYLISKADSLEEFFLRKKKKTQTSHRYFHMEPSNDLLSSRKYVFFKKKKRFWQRLNGTC